MQPLGGHESAWAGPLRAWRGAIERVIPKERSTVNLAKLVKLAFNKALATDLRDVLFRSDANPRALLTLVSGSAL